MEENGCWHDIEMIKLKDDPLYELKGIQRIIEECKQISAKKNNFFFNLVIMNRKLLD